MPSVSSARASAELCGLWQRGGRHRCGCAGGPGASARSRHEPVQLRVGRGGRRLHVRHAEDGRHHGHDRLLVLHARRPGRLQLQQRGPAARQQPARRALLLQHAGPRRAARCRLQLRDAGRRPGGSGRQRVPAGVRGRGRAGVLALPSGPGAGEDERMVPARSLHRRGFARGVQGMNPLLLCLRAPAGRGESVQRDLVFVIAAFFRMALRSSCFMLQSVIGMLMEVKRVLMS